MSKEQWDAIRGVVNKVIVPTGAVLGVFAALFVGITYIIGASGYLVGEGSRSNPPQWK
jgi:hypothetical protein